MTSRINILVLSLFTFLSVACAERDVPTPDDQIVGVANLELTTSVYGEANPNTDNFVDGSKFRLAVYDYDNINKEYTDNIYLYSSLGSMYKYILSTKIASGWKFSFDDNSETGSRQLGFVKDANKSIYLVAVSPYVADSNIKNIYYKISDNRAYMLAKSEEPEGISLAENVITTTLNFKPVVAALNFRTRLLNNALGVDITAIRLSLADADGKPKEKIVSVGRLDSFQGEFLENYRTYVDNAEIIINRGVSEFDPDVNVPDDEYFYREIPAYLYPIEMESTDVLTISLVVDGQELEGKIKLKGSDFSGGVGMKAGVRYNLDIEIDNYLKYSGVLIEDSEWIEGDTINTDI